MDKLARRIRLYLLTAFLGLSAQFSKAVEIPPGTVRDFSCGLATKEDPADIGDGCSQDLSNVDVNTGAIEKRRGSVKANSTVLGSFTTQATRFLHEFVDSSNNVWLLSVSSNTLFKSNDGGATNTIVTSTYGITSTSRFCGVNAFGYARLTDGTTNWMLFDGNTLSASTAPPLGKTCEFFGERVLTSVGSVFYGSRYGDAMDWTADAGTDNDAFSTQVRQNDGFNIRAIKKFRFGVLVFKDYSTDLFTLSADGLTFIQTPVSNTVGTSNPESVAERENDVIWLGHDGYYSFNGTQINKISEIIRPTVYQIQQLSSFERTYTETSQVDFTGGTHFQTSKDITAGSVVNSTYSETDTTTAEFSAGSTSSTTILNNRVYLSTNNTNVDNNSFELGSGSLATNWTIEAHSGNGATTTGPCGGAVKDGTRNMRTQGTSTSSTGRLLVLDTSSVIIATVTTWTVGDGTECSQQQLSGDLTSFVGRWIKLRIHPTGSTGDSVISDSFICSGSTVTFWRAWENAGLNDKRQYFDLFEGGRSSITSGTFTSAAVDTAFTSATWLTSTATYTTNNHAITWQTQSSSDGSNWQTAASWSPNSIPASDNRRYIRYVATLSTGGTTNGVALPYIDDVSIGARAILGRYVSTSILTSAGTSWNLFSGDSSVGAGGTVTFEIYTDTDTVMVATDTATYISSQTITSGGTPSVTINTYAHVGALIELSTASQNPSMDEFTLAWNEGSSVFPVSSLYYQGTYCSAVALNRTDRNDSMLCYDINGAWTIYTYPAYYLTRYRQRPYFGSAIQGDIVRFQADGIYQDFDSSAITAYWISKEFDFGFPLTKKTINRYYVTAKYRANDEATFEWGVNRGSLTSESSVGTLDLDSTTGFFRKSITPSSLTFKNGLSHRFKFSNSTLGDRFDILSVTLKADLETSP